MKLESVEDFELLVVDNGTTDATPSVVKEFARTAPFCTGYVSEPRAGLSFARNRGLASASGDLIMFTDDDCLVASDWVQTALEAFAGDFLKIVGGKVELFNKDHLPFPTNAAAVRETLASAGQVLSGLVIGANMAFGRGVVDRIGLFDVRLGAGTSVHAAEDTDFVYRALVAGISVTYEPSLVVYHDHGRTGARELIRLHRGYAMGGGAMMMKHLLRGRTDLIRPIYWDSRSAVRGWRTHPARWRSPLSKLGYVAGAIQFLIQESWRRSAD